MSRETTPSTAPTSRSSWSDAASRDALQLIAEGVTELAGFGIAAISVVRDDGLLESVAVAGSEEARAQLAGTRSPVHRLEAEIAKADNWGLLRFVPHERLEPGLGDTWGWVPDIEPIDDAPDAWHPLDLLIAPLYDDEGTLRGTLAMDLPVDGRRPGEAQRAVINRYAEQAGRAVVIAIEREALAERVRMADATRTIVRKATQQLSLERVVADCRDALIDGFRADGLWMQTFDRDAHSPGTIYSATGSEIRLTPDLVEIARVAAESAWRTQTVAALTADGPMPPPLDHHQAEIVRSFLRAIEVASLIFVPLGAGPECVGNLVLTRLDGGPEWTESEATAALDIGHDLGRAILNARTFEREHELVEELRELDSYKSQLIATVAHELKNPLTSVLGHLEILDLRPELSDASRGSLQVMERGAQRMVKVIDDLLLLASVGDPSTPLHSEAVDLTHVVDEVVDLVAVTAKQKSIDIHLDLPASPVLALGDAGELDRVCTNLLSNAVKYTPDGGSVTLRVLRTPREVALEVADGGIGISPEDLARLGTEFFRSSNPAALAVPGTGLGLAIVRRIVERHHGRLDIESELGRGSTFRVHLPAA